MVTGLLSLPTTMISLRNSMGSAKFVRLKLNFQCIQLSEWTPRNHFWVINVLLCEYIKLRTPPQLRLSSVASSGYQSGHNKGNTCQRPHHTATGHLNRICVSNRYVGWPKAPGPYRKHCLMVSTKGGAIGTLRRDVISLAPVPHRYCTGVRHRWGLQQPECSK